MILWEDNVQIYLDVLCPYVQERPFSNAEHQMISAGRKRVIEVVHYENTPIQIYRKFHLHKLKKI